MLTVRQFSGSCQELSSLVECRRKGILVLFELKPEQKLATLNVLQIHNQMVGPYLLCNSKTVKNKESTIFVHERKMCSAY